MRCWEVCGSLDEGSGNRRRFTVMVSAKEARDVLKAVEARYPRLFIWSIQNKGTVEFLNADEKREDKAKNHSGSVDVPGKITKAFDDMSDVEDFVE